MIIISQFSVELFIDTISVAHDTFQSHTRLSGWWKEEEGARKVYDVVDLELGHFTLYTVVSIVVSIIIAPSIHDMNIPHTNTAHVGFNYTPFAPASQKCLLSVLGGVRCAADSCGSKASTAKVLLLLACAHKQRIITHRAPQHILMVWTHVRYVYSVKRIVAAPWNRSSQPVPHSNTFSEKTPAWRGIVADGTFARRSLCNGVQPKHTHRYSHH